MLEAVGDLVRTPMICLDRSGDVFLKDFLDPCRSFGTVVTPLVFLSSF